jgi:WD40 repeat protein
MATWQSLTFQTELCKKVNFFTPFSSRKAVFEQTKNSGSINKLNWLPKSSNLLLTGTQEGELSLWDRTIPSQIPVIQTQGMNGIVRDVKANPFNENQFIVAYDDGSISVTFSI